MGLESHRHGPGARRTRGMHMGHGFTYDVLATVLFGGRRQRVFRHLATLSGAGPGDRVLDAGCGTGYFTRVMARAVGPGGTALGIDPSPRALARARRVTRSANCSFAEGTAERLDAPDGSFNVVVTSLMIHHLPEELRPRAMAEMFRVLRPGGRILVADFRPPANPLVRRLIHPVTSPAMEHNPVEQIKPMIHEAGFVQVLSGDIRPWIHYVTAAKPE